MKTSTKRIVSIFAAGLFSIGTVLVYSFFIQPELASVKEARALVFSKTQALKSRKSAISRVQGLLATVRGSDQFASTIAQILPSSRAVTGLLNDVYAIAGRHQVFLRSLSFQSLPLLTSSGKLVEPVGVIQVTMGVEGSYDGVRGFLTSVQTNVRLFDVKSFQVTSGRGLRAGDDFLAATAVFRAYYQE